MGSWYKTCAMSNLHVYSEPCQMFVIKQNQPGADRCYSTALWSPLLYPIACTYYDYGTATNLEPIVFNLIISKLKQSIDKYSLGNNPYHDIEVNPDLLDEKLFFEAVNESRLTITSTRSSNLRRSDYRSSRLCTN